MTNYLFATNTNNFIIDKHIINSINQFISLEIKSNFKFKILNYGHAFEWIIYKKNIKNIQKKNLKHKFSSLPIDFNFINIEEPRKKKLLLADMDSTIIEEESLDEIAKFVGLNDEIKKITEDAMNGLINFEEAIQKRVFLLKNLPYKFVENFLTKINFSDGSIELIKFMRSHNSKTVLISGSFLPIIKYVSKKLKFHFFHGNDFIYKKNNNGETILSGQVKMPILNKNTKLDFLKRYRSKFNLLNNDIIAVGDGANDIKMIQESGIGVSYKGKAILEKMSDVNFNHTNLKGILYLQGYDEKLINNS